MNIVSKTKVSISLRFSVEHNMGLFLPVWARSFYEHRVLPSIYSMWIFDYISTMNEELYEVLRSISFKRLVLGMLFS